MIKSLLILVVLMGQFSMASGPSASQPTLFKKFQLGKTFKQRMPTKNAVISFQIEQTGKNLALTFKNDSKTVELNRNTSLHVDLVAPPGLQISPTSIDEQDWPAASNRLPLTVSIMDSSIKKFHITGEASFQMCKVGTTSCTPGKSHISFDFKP